MLILRRKTFLINRKLQFSMLLTSLSYVGFLFVVMSIALFLPPVLELNLSGRSHAENSDAALRILYLHQVYWLPVLLTLLVVTLHSIWTSHRIAGPIYRFRRVCEALMAGVVPRKVRLRKGDHLQAELDMVNGMLDKWRGVVSDVKRDLARLHESVTDYGDVQRRRPLGPVGSAAWAQIVETERHLRETLARISCEDDPPEGDRGPGRGEPSRV